MFALTRNKAKSVDLLNLESKQKNVHVLQADITDVSALRVWICISASTPLLTLQYGRLWRKRLKTSPEAHWMC